MFTKPRQPFVGFALCAVAGILAADFLAAHARLIWIPAAVLAGIALGTVAWLHRANRKSAARVFVWLAVIALFFAWHAFRLGAGPGRRLADRISSSGCVLRVIGVVNEEPLPDSRFRVRLESVAFHDGPLEPCRAEVLVSWKKARLAYGDRVELIGSARNLRPPANPGGPESVAHRHRQGIFSEIRVRYSHDGKILEHNQGTPILALAYRLRQKAEKTLSVDLEDAPTEVALMRCMVLGSRTEESMRELEDRFQYTGAIHLYAVTGMNVVLLALMARFILEALRLPRRAVFLALLPVVWLYTFATGMGTSTLRAAVMISIFLIGALIERPALSWNSLGIATVAVLACQPGQLFKHGFVFSFVVVAVMMAIATRLQNWLARFGAPDPLLPRSLWTRSLQWREGAANWLAGWIAAGVTAWLASIPLMLFYFRLWSPATLPANLIGGLLTFAVIGLGIGSVLAGTFCPWLAAVLNNANWLFVKGVVLTISTFSAIPGGYQFVDLPSPGVACEIEVLDLPAGGAAHLRVLPKPFDWRRPFCSRASHHWLIDCGSASAFPRTVLPYLRSRGVNRLDGLILTHGDSQHIGGTLGALRSVTPADVFDSALKDQSRGRKAIYAALAAAQRGKAIVQRGDAITLGPGVVLRVLYPPEDLIARSADDKALVLRLDSATARVLFTSDAGFITEHWLLEHVPAEEIRCDVLIKGMHAKDLSGTPEFLKAAGAKVVIASSTDFPQTEQISDEWAAQTRALGIRLMRSDETGAVRVTIPRKGQWEAEATLAGESAR